MPQLRRRLALLLAIGALSSGAVACSDDDGGGNGNLNNGNLNNGNLNHNEPLPDFPLRALSSHELTCSGATGSYWDADFVCQVPIDATTVDLYVQATPTACQNVGLSNAPLFGDVSVYYRRDGLVWPTEGHYLWGGNHHNDAIQFALDGQLYVIWHSSIGAGARVCAPPDCLLVCEEGATFDSCDAFGGYAFDGCERDPGDPPPPLPAICVPVSADGSVPPLLDPWQNPDPPLLPCTGDA